MTILQDFVNTLPGQENVNPPASPGDILTYAFPSELLARLQREQGWTPAFTLLAVGEYRRFVHLAVTAPHPVTPSSVVDEVWHTHLMFTRDYWLRFTPLLPAPLHHEPGDGTPASDAHFRSQYTRTLDLYHVTFGHVPPPEVWPDPRQGRAGTSSTPRRAWILPVAALLAGGVFLILHSVFVAGFIFVLALILLGSFSQAQGRPGRGGQGNCGGGFADGVFADGDSCDSSDSSGCADTGSSCGSSCGSGCGGGCGS